MAGVGIPLLAQAGLGSRTLRRQMIRERLSRSIARVGGRFPPMAANPPTLTVSAANAATTIAGSVMFNFAAQNAPDVNRRLYDLVGGSWEQPYQTFPGYLFVRPYAYHYGNPLPADNPGADAGPKIIFGFDGDRLEMLAQASTFRVLVDGSYAVSGGTSVIANTRTLLTFPDARERTIEFEFAGCNGVTGIQCDPATPPYKPVRADNLRVVVNADSFGNTVIASAADKLAARNTGLGACMGRLLGQADTINSGVGGSGYLNPANNGGNNFGQRVDLDIIAPRPDVVFELGGLNDNSFLKDDATKRAALRAAIDDWLRRVTTALPDALIVMTGPMSPNGDNLENIVWVRDIKRDAAAVYSRQVVFIDNIGDGVDKGWVTGTVNNSRPGNAARVTGTDLTHPSIFGAEYLARRIVGATAAALR